MAPGEFDNFIVAPADGVMSRPNEELVAEVLPETPIRSDRGVTDTMLGIDKARAAARFQRGAVLARRGLSPCFSGVHAA